MALAVTSAIWQQINSPSLDIRRFISADIQEGVVGATDLAGAQPGARANLATLTGAAAAPPSSLLLANVLVPANATTITTANIDTTVRTRVTSAAPGMVLIQDQLLAATATSVVFSAIPGTYKHLLVE